MKRACGDSRHSESPVLEDEHGREYISSADKAAAFASFFSKKCSLGNDFGDELLPPVTPRNHEKISKVHFRKETVTRSLKHLDPSKATGPDGVPGIVLKMCAAELGGPLSKLFSILFRTGVQPLSWKVANVVPMHKKKSKSALKNYRPVSLLSILYKVMESIVNKSLVKFLETHTVLSRHQFGFRRGLGSSDLLTLLHHQWCRTAGEGGVVRILAADIAGAFDKVSHKGVLHKASSYGISGQLFSWLQSYLSDRRIKAVINGYESPLYPITAGVPQGSILGPTLFLLYVNDCEHHLSPGVGLAVYADDTTIYHCIPTPTPDTASVLQTAVDALARWGRTCKITFEPTKSQVMTISHRTRTPDFPPVSFNDTLVSETSQLHLLGVTFDHQLSFRTHLRAVSNRGRSRLHFLRKCAPILDPRGRERVYKGFVRPLLEYSPLVWVGAPSTHIQLLDKVQQSALKIIHPQTWLYSLPLRRDVAALTYLYKLHYLPRDSPLRVMVPNKVPASRPRPCTRALSRPRHAIQLAHNLPVRARNNTKRSFPAGVVDTWNDLPPPLLGSPPLSPPTSRHLRSVLTTIYDR